MRIFRPLDPLVPIAVFCLIAGLLALNFWFDSQSLAAFLGESNFIAYVHLADYVILPITVSTVIALAANLGKVLLSYHLSTRDFRGRWTLKALVRSLYAMIIACSLVLTQLFLANQLLDARMDTYIATEQQRLDTSFARRNLEINARFRLQLQQEQALLDAPLTDQLAVLDLAISEAKDGMNKEIPTGAGLRYEAHKALLDQAMGERLELLTDVSDKRADIMARLNAEQQAMLDQSKADEITARDAISPLALQGQPYVQNASMLSFAQLLTTVAGGDQTKELVVAPATLAVLATIFLSLMIEFLIVLLLTVVFLPRKRGAVPSAANARPAGGGHLTPVPNPHDIAAE